MQERCRTLLYVGNIKYLRHLRYIPVGVPFNTSCNHKHCTLAVTSDTFTGTFAHSVYIYIYTHIYIYTYIYTHIYIYIYIKVKWSRYRPGVAQRVGRDIALLFHDRGTWRGWVVSSTPRPHFTLAKDPVPILQEVGWASGPVWTGGKSRSHRESIPDRPARSQSLYRLNYRDLYIYIYIYIYMCVCVCVCVHWKC